MKVSELIEQLQQYNGELQVFAFYGEIENARLNKEHYFGDQANPNCRIGEAVELE